MLFWTKMKAAAVAVVLSLSGLVGTVLVVKAAGTSDQPGLTGAITQISDGSISIQPNNGQPITVKFNNATVIKVNGQVAKAADLKVGMKAAVIGQHLSKGQPATEIRAYMPAAK